MCRQPITDTTCCNKIIDCLAQDGVATESHILTLLAYHQQMIGAVATSLLYSSRAATSCGTVFERVQASYLTSVMTQSTDTPIAVAWRLLSIIEMAGCAVDKTERLDTIVDVIVSELIENTTRMDLVTDAHAAMTLLSAAFDEVHSSTTRARLAYHIGRLVPAMHTTVYSAEHWLRWCIDMSKNVEGDPTPDVKLYSDLAYIELATMTPWHQPIGLYPAVCKFVIAGMMHRGTFVGDVRDQIIESVQAACSVHLSTAETNHVIKCFQIDNTETTRAFEAAQTL